MFFSPAILLPLLSTLLAGNKNRRTTNNNYLKNTHHMILHQFVGQKDQQKDQQQEPDWIYSSSSVWIDMENVRGKSGFLLSHNEVLDKTEVWTKHFGLQDRVIVVVDHGGSEPTAFFKEDQNLAVVFSGNNCKADDVIAKGVGASCFPFFGADGGSITSANDVVSGSPRGKQRRAGGVGKTIVVTADNELMSRCRKAAKNEYHIVNPQTFLDDLEWVANEVRQQQREKQQQHQQQQQGDLKDDDESSTSSSSTLAVEAPPPTVLSVNEEFKLGRLDTEIKLRGQLINAEVQLGDRKKKGKKITNKRRKKLEARVKDLKRKLAMRGPSLLDQLTRSSEAGGSEDDENGSGDLAREQQDLLLEKWRELQYRPPRKEQTGDRVIYAERLRRELEADDHVTTDMMANKNCESTIVASGTTSETETTDSNDNRILSSARLFVKHVNDGKLFVTTPKKTVARGTITNLEDAVLAKQNALLSSPTPKLTKEQRLTLMTSGPVVAPEQQSSNSYDYVYNHDRDYSTLLPSESDGIVLSSPEMSTKERLAFKVDTNLQTLDIVVVSDTHGFEGQLGDELPKGDVLLHLGDFALEGSSEKECRGLSVFDKWLAKQPHDYKIVIRGNHDPFKVAFPTSKALYVTNPTSVNIGGFECALVPHCNARKLSASRGLPPTCDLVASHVPPFKVLDRTYSGKHVGSSFLNNFVRGMALGPPRLWLVGHIHEARGVAKRKFAKNKHQETTVINASNANMGCATHLQHGPVVLRINKDNPEVEILQMDDKSINKHVLSKTNAAFYDGAGSSDATSTTTEIDGTSSGYNNNQLLMAVDLGLKSGVSLFDSRGNLLRYQQFLFDRESLQQDFEDIIHQWETEAFDPDGKEQNNGNNNSPSKITHIAIEGGDTGLLDTWAQAAPNHSILRVSPEEWRSELLSKKESQNGGTAKEASRLIARQVVADFGTMDQHVGKFPTDVAESVCLGMYVARRLGWIEREPAVRRFTNGNVVTPKKIKGKNPVLA
mmetsp:Transcript_26850/g.57928  ORF Transcript_26850/g.57928 Transcript_26850/m.57928 type:complete len:1005 (+) Transcript_26850:131-3145(+)